MAAGALVNTPTGIAEVLSLWVPPGQLWFLPWLALVTVVTVPRRPWRSRRAGTAVLVTSALVSLAAWGWDPPIIGLRGLALSVFFVAGVLVGSERFSRTLRGARTSLLGGAVVLGSTVVWAALTVGPGAATPTAAYPHRSVATVAAGVAGAVGGAVALVAVAVVLVRLGGFSQVLALLGERSLEIFLVHVVAASGLRIVLSAAGVHDAIVHIVAGTVVGLLVPVLAWWVARRLGWRWPFALPARVDPRRS